MNPTEHQHAPTCIVATVGMYTLGFGTGMCIGSEFGSESRTLSIICVLLVVTGIILTLVDWNHNHDSN